MQSFDLTTTHAMSILAILLLFILFFQPKIYGRMTQTFLGRLTLLFILLLVASYNFIYGIVCVVVIISLFEYYERFEGVENMGETTTNESKSNTKSKSSDEKDSIEKDAGKSSVPAKVSNSDNTTISESNTSDKMDTSKVTELDIMSKPKSSKQLEFNSSTSSENVVPSEASVSKTSAKEGFANMVGLEYLNF
jgi:predicted membrane protein